MDLCIQYTITQTSEYESDHQVKGNNIPCGISTAKLEELEREKGERTRRKTGMKEV